MLEESGRKTGRGNLRRRRMDIGNHFECRGNNNREIGGWMRERSVLLDRFRQFWMSSRGEMSGEVWETNIFL